MVTKSRWQTFISNFGYLFSIFIVYDQILCRRTFGNPPRSIQLIKNSPVAVEDAGVYQCSATFTNAQITPIQNSVSVNVYSKKTLQKFDVWFIDILINLAQLQWPPNFNWIIKPVQGREVRFECPVTAVPKPRIIWSKQSGSKSHPQYREKHK